MNVTLMLQANMFRRPIIVYGLSKFTDNEGVALQQAYFAGVYLPALYELVHIHPHTHVPKQ